MSRRPRLTYPGATHHVMGRANGKQKLFVDQDDRFAFLNLLSVARDIYDVEWEMYMLMNTHFHAKVRTPHANISAAMQYVEGQYAEWWNKQHHRRGHVFEGRFKSPLIEDGRYAFTVMRYIALNPVKAGYVARAVDWPWSSHRALAGVAPAPQFLEIDWLRHYFDGPTLRACQRQYGRFVDAQHCPDVDGGEPVAVGSPEFQENVRELIGSTMHQIIVPRSYRALGRPRLGKLFAGLGHDLYQRNQMILRAQVVHGYTQAEIARALALHPNTISKITRRIRQQHYFIVRLK